MRLSTAALPFDDSETGMFRAIKPIFVFCLESLRVAPRSLNYDEQGNWRPMG